MPTARKPRALYVAKNMSELHAEGDKVDKIVANTNSHMLVVSVDRMQSQGFKSLEAGDQEKAYVSFYRLTQVLLALKDKPDFKQHEDYLNKIFPKTKLLAVMDKLEELGEILKSRYDLQYPDFSEKALKEKLSSGKTRDVKPLNGIQQNLPSVPNHQIAPKSTENDTTTTIDKVPDSQSIKVEDLRSLIEQQSTRLLIIDCRSLSSYEKSHIKHSNCISIPDSILEKGLSANKLTERLQTMTEDEDRNRQLCLWNTREKYDRIILYDWNSSFDSRDLDARIWVLYDALTKWDIGRKYQCVPEIVTGGFREITYKYPTLLTNAGLSTYDEPAKFGAESVASVPDLSSISYPNFDTEDELSSRTKKLGITTNSANNVINNNLPVNSSSSILTPDRSKKPIRILPKIPPPEVPHHIHDHESSEVDEPAGGAEEETKNNDILESVPSQSLVTIPDRSAKPPRKVFSDANADSISSQNGVPENDDSTRLPKSTETSRPPSTVKSEVQRPETPPNMTSPKHGGSYGCQPIKDEPSGFMNGDLSDKTMKSSMKRSKSIPNLKQIGDEADLSPVTRVDQKPTYERNLKPTQFRSSFEAYAGRRRDFEIVSSSTRCITGLKNLGNTCYMNSVLQCLLSTPHLVNYFLGTPGDAYRYRKDINYQSKTKGHTTEEFAALIREISNGHRSIAPKDFVSVTAKLIQHATYGQQQDSNEFLLAFIDSLNEELNKIRINPPAKLQEQNNENFSDEVAANLAWENFKSLNDSIMIDLFWGQQKSCVTCLTCGKRSVTFDTFSMLPLPIRSTKRCDITACLDLYTTEEEISEYECKNCKRKGRATKKLDLWKLPMYLIVQFQRFYNDGFWKKKVTDIDFPLETFDLSPYVKDGGYNNRYNLYGVSNHMGTMEGGHYTAFCRRGRNWYEFDDSVVRQLGRRQDIVTQNGYIVFYQRCS